MLLIGQKLKKDNMAILSMLQETQTQWKKHHGNFFNVTHRKKNKKDTMTYLSMYFFLLHIWGKNILKKAKHQFYQCVPYRKKTEKRDNLASLFLFFSCC